MYVSRCRILKERGNIGRKACRILQKHHLQNFCFGNRPRKDSHAVLDADQSKVVSLQKDLRLIAQKMEHTYFITASHLLSSLQLHYLGKIGDALIESQDAEKTATQYRQGLWLTRARINLLEQRKIQSLPVQANEVMMVLEAAIRQKQDEIIHRCYKLLSELGLIDAKSKQDWSEHWNSWKERIPEAYRSNFDPQI